jgi:PAS domain S-box-containing protein
VIRWFRRLPLHRKLVTSALLITAVALAIAMLGLGAFDAWRSRATASEDAQAVARVLAENIAAAVAFQDADAAREILASVRVREVVSRACVYLPDGSLFAAFEQSALACPPTAPTDATWQGVFGLARVVRNERAYGSIVVERSLADLRGRLLLTVLAGAAMFLVAALAAYLLAERVHRASSAPVSDLARFARAFGDDPGQEVPAIATDPDEIGELVTAFAAMAARIRGTNDALRRQTTQLRLITDAVPALISYVTADGTYQFSNRAYEEWFGRSRETIDGRHLRDVLGIDAYERIRPHAEMALRGKRIQFEAEVPYRDGGTRHVRADYVPDTKADGTVAGFFALVADVTERKQVELALRDADRRKDEFLAILAHELRNPLAPIRTGVDLLRVSRDKPAALDRIQPMLDRQVGYMVRLIDDLLDISRITSGRIHLQRRPTPLAELVESAVEANRSAIEAAGLELRVSVADGPCFVDVDPTRFVQVLSNVVQNAVKFTERGHIAIVGGPDPDAVTPSVVVTISDTGAGISATTLPRVFQLFTQGAPVGRSKSGLGIGLALARRLVEMHSGTIDAASGGEGRGSTFTIRMPAVTGAADPAAVSPAPRAEAIRGKVLIIDDNIDAASTLSALVSALGGEARTANDGESGIRQAVDFRPDAIFLDIGMPGLDGYETCRRLREHPAGRTAYVVALTGWGQPQDRERALALGFDAHVTKPADPATLAALLGSLPKA